MESYERAARRRQCACHLLKPNSSRSSPPITRPSGRLWLLFGSPRLGSAWDWCVIAGAWSLSALWLPRSGSGRERRSTPSSSRVSTRRPGSSRCSSWPRRSRSCGSASPPVEIRLGPVDASRACRRNPRLPALVSCPGPAVRPRSPPGAGLRRSVPDSAFHRGPPVCGRSSGTSLAVDSLNGKSFRHRGRGLVWSCLLPG